MVDVGPIDRFRNGIKSKWQMHEKQVYRMIDIKERGPVAACKILFRHIKQVGKRRNGDLENPENCTRVYMSLHCRKENSSHDSLLRNLQAFSQDGVQTRRRTYFLELKMNLRSFDQWIEWVLGRLGWVHIQQTTRQLWILVLRSKTDHRNQRHSKGRIFRQSLHNWVTIAFEKRYVKQKMSRSWLERATWRQSQSDNGEAVSQISNDKLEQVWSDIPAMETVPTLLLCRWIHQHSLP